MDTVLGTHSIKFGAYFSKADWHSGDYWIAPQTVKGSTEFPKYTGVNYNMTTTEGRCALDRLDVLMCAM